MLSYRSKRANQRKRERGNIGACLAADISSPVATEGANSSSIAQKVAFPSFVLVSNLFSMTHRNVDLAIVAALQHDLQSFLADQRRAAEQDPEWIAATASATQEEMDAEPGCGCNACILAANLLREIY